MLFEANNFSPNFSFCVIGHPVSHSKSPDMQNNMFQKFDLKDRYGCVDVSPDNLILFLQNAKKAQIKGFNVTVPLKECFFQTDVYDTGLVVIENQQAQKIGAINTVVDRGGQYFGYNTDGDGFLLGIKEECGFSLKHTDKVALIGSGGSAKSIAVSLCNNGIESLLILNRTENKASMLISELQKYFPAIDFSFGSLCDTNLLRDTSLVINTTSVGMTPNESDCPIQDFSWVHDSMIVYDIIYAPSETIFLKEARHRGARTLNGKSMLAGQGALAFKIFTGFTGDYHLMRKGLD